MKAAWSSRLRDWSARGKVRCQDTRFSVAIIQPWLPQYRVAFFEKLIDEAAAVGIEIKVFHGSPNTSMAGRGDAVTSGWATEVPTKFFSLRGRTLNWKDLKAFRRAAPYDLVIVEQAIRNLETYAICLMRCTRHLAFWGHGKTYTEKPAVFSEKLKSLLTGTGDWFFAYTSGGAKAVVSSGFDPARVSVLNNSVDTTALRLELSRAGEWEIDEFKKEHGLMGRTAFYIGALDEGKRISWLIQAAELAHRADPLFRLMIAGDGRDKQVVERAALAHEWLTYLGPLFGPAKAVALAACDVIAMPGRVGLAAVDSFTAERPIVTTQWPFHAPEFEYLESGVNSLIVRDDVSGYGQALCSLLADSERLFLLRQGCRESAQRFSVERMAASFLDGVRSVLGH